MLFRKKIFYGWIVVFCGVILAALGVGMFTNTNSLFVKPVCESLGFARGKFSLYRTVIQLTAALTMPLYGRLIKKAGVKRVFLAGVFMLALVSAGYSFSNTLWHFYLLAFVNGLFLNSISFMSIGVLVSAWFDGKKGLATGLAYSGSGLGGFIMLPAVGRVIELAGWRTAYRAMGILGVAALLPVVIIFVKNSPKDIGLAPLLPDAPGEKTARGAAVNYRFAEAFRTPKFWLITVAVFFFNFFSGAGNTHTAAFLSDIGYPGVFVSAVMSVYMIAVTLGKIMLGSVYDRFGVKTGNLVISLFCLAFPLFALMARVSGAAWVFAVLLGIASSGVSVPISILTIRHFGDRDFPVIFSFFMTVSSLSPSFSVPAMGAVYDFTGSYNPAWIAFFIGSLIISACLIGTEIPQRLPAQRREQAEP